MLTFLWPEKTDGKIFFGFVDSFFLALLKALYLVWLDFVSSTFILNWFAFTSKSLYLNKRVYLHPKSWSIVFFIRKLMFDEFFNFFDLKTQDVLNMFLFPLHLEPYPLVWFDYCIYKNIGFIFSILNKTLLSKDSKLEIVCYATFFY